jgi:hypothetical protein
VVSTLRTLALLALLLPALLVPRGLVVSLCLCGYGLDANVCVAQVGPAGEVLGCTCSLGLAPCTEHADELESDAPCADVAHGPACPLCHAVSLDEPSVDYVATAVPQDAPLAAIAAPASYTVALAPPTAPAATANERAPPVAAHVSPGLWIGVRPLRI